MTVGLRQNINRHQSDHPCAGLTTQEEILSAFEAHLNGDRSINVYDLFRAISAQTAKGNKAFLGRPLEWESDCLQKWHKQFKYGVSITPLSDYDTRQRVHILLTSNLLPFEGSNELRYKQTLLRRNSHLI